MTDDASDKAVTLAPTGYAEIPVAFRAFEQCDSRLHFLLYLESLGRMASIESEFSRKPPLATQGGGNANSVHPTDYAF